ncbi:MAG: phosphoglucosamine mutase [Candidatus Eremiobacter antarcticus]|nr:phosphoglucosamine mutase [Candidatus Eremiobacteraeota bacterium]MBC5808878.1 phosphoglucosamine mutase [Candidatus Eremiobacteraeota bacterium]PZR60437.1 MAG: phosphoglucosamine mutase [Candidatus Eremiobacter sp. RRmetagenome_bin22]
MNKLFGTDGVRGVANEFLTPELAFALGRAGGYVLAQHGARRPVIVGRDTRRSGPMLEQALTAGICSIGLDVWTLGVVPTPGVAYLTRHLNAAAGVMISASHNAIEDNGIKFFASDGCKLSDALEDEIAAKVDDGSKLPRPTGMLVGNIVDRRRVVNAYLEHCCSLGVPLEGKTVVLDAAHGAAYDIAPKVFARLGARVVRLHCTANSKKINVRCGSTDLTAIRATVAQHPGSIGVAFDGDADRALFIDEEGQELTGDHVLAMCAKKLLSQDALPHKTVVATVMSNIGLERALHKMEAELLRTPVGDRYVLEAMQRGGFRLGGEQSGHIIDLQANTTGDGIATAVMMSSLAAGERRLADLASIMQQYPQVLINVSVPDKASFDRDTQLLNLIDKTQQVLGANGRVLVRASGTEPLVRVMIEGQEEAHIRELAERIAEQIASAQHY